MLSESGTGGLPLSSGVRSAFGNPAPVLSDGVSAAAWQ